MEKGFVSQEFAAKVRERMNHMEKQTQKEGVSSVNNVKEDKATVPEKKQTETVRKQEGETVVKQQAETVGKKNNQRQKGNDDTGKPKRKLKPKVS